MDKPTASASESGATFRSRRLLRHSPEDVFEAFRQPALLSQWWGPKGFTNTFEVCDFSPGGVWKFVMHGPDGSHHPNESVFLEIDPPSRVVIRHVCPPHFVLTVGLTRRHEGTELDWFQTFDDEGVAARVRRIVASANEENMDRLEAVLAARGRDA